MQLYFSPGACSLTPHIALREAGLEFSLERVDLGTKKTASGDDFTAINPRGYVPALRLQDGEILTECPVILQYVADLVPDRELAPPAGTMARYRLQERLNFITSELHKSFNPLFHKECPDAWKATIRSNLGRRFDELDALLGRQPFVMGSGFTVADPYLYNILNWTRLVQIDLATWPNLQAFRSRIAERPAVEAALAAEGLLKKR
jgi:glutathione S-transferase